MLRLLPRRVVWVVCLLPLVCSIEANARTGPGVQSVSISPSSVIGSVNTATATVTLTAPCNTFSLDVSMSNTNAAAYTASILTFSYGQQSKTITVNTRLTSSPVSAGITGTANGVSATGYVTVTPISVS